MEPLLMETEYEKPLVLVVDDDPTNLRILVSKLNREYRLGVAQSGTKAWANRSLIWYCSTS